ncbi:Uncharacterised protein [Chlamydia trachomatis]|nr:Uncharacterised protein [Chlamydia trachomatis]
MTSAITAKAFDQAAQHKLTVSFEHHIDKVNDDDTADISQSQLPHNFFRGFQIIFGYGFFERSTSACELSSIDIDNSHRFCAVNHKRTARRQIHCAIKCFSELFINSVSCKNICTILPLTHPSNQLWRKLLHVFRNRLPRVFALYAQRIKIFVENVTHYAHC